MDTLQHLLVPLHGAQVCGHTPSTALSLVPDMAGNTGAAV